MKDYKKILEGVVNIINTTEKSDIGFVNICSYIGENCPELKESEGENIRKSLIHLVKKSHEYGGYALHKDETEKMLAWLEKQGEQKPIIEMKSPEESLGIDSDTYNKIVDECVYGEQKPTDNVEPKFKVGQTIKKEGFNSGFPIVKIEDGFYYNDMGDNFPFTDQDSWELVEQKPTDADLKDIVDKEANSIWKEINTGGSHSIIDSFNQFYGICMQVAEAVVDYRKPAEWSEEDEDIIQALNACINAAIKSGMNYISFDSKSILIEKVKNWLKFLKYRYTWKPSEEEMEALRKAEATIGVNHVVLAGLISDLEKLKE